MTQALINHLATQYPRSFLVKIINYLSRYPNAKLSLQEIEAQIFIEEMLDTQDE